MSVFIGYPSFMAYQMMKGKKGNNDGFPSIPGITARYSALGLTNEQMATNPVWVDKTGNDHDLQMKNFAWGGMSGVGGYKLNWSNSNTWANYITQGTFGTGEVTDNTIHITSAKTNNALFETRASLKSVEYKVLIKGLTDDIYLRYGVFNDGKELWTEIKNDGIYILPSYDYDSRYNMKWKVMSQTYPIDCNITIEQLPLYPGALVFDEVDDYGVCDNFPILTKEKGYTVVALRQWITRGKGALGLVSNVKNWLKDGAFLLEYRNIQADHLNKPISFGAIGGENDLPHILTYQTSKSYNGVSITTGNFEGTDVLHVGKLAPTKVGTCINAAIWELIFLDHDATEEELTKIKDYFVKTYPWLFPDQAWTTVGKTNEDEDRATIANITGNGNDLVLSNFGFIEGSGYNEEGEHAGYLVTDGVDDMITSSTFEMGKDFTVVGEWTLLQNINVSSLRMDGSFVIRNNEKNGLSLLLDRVGSYAWVPTKSLKAFCSNGTIYKSDWTEQIETVTKEGTGGNRQLTIAGRNNNMEFDKIAFKNLAIYPTVLSKDDCIKAYNYLQTLKAK